MPTVIGTAGHIDHGKTMLVKALTGEDTDRLKEEKERGISIDLGFAHLDLPDGTRAGVVDVPGHERFIRNMLAGAHGIDLVLFTVAADDGVMPQTEEHFDIIHLLGVARAIFVITKADLVSDARLLEVEEEIGALAAGTAFEQSPMVRVSAVTGQGMPELRRLIVENLGSHVRRRGLGYFRLPVDRVFVLQGHGLIVTGTSISGEIRFGDHVRCLPGGHLLRVRGLQVHNEPVQVAQWGQRVALNLSGHEAPPIGRGHVLCHEAITMVSNRFDAVIEVRPTAAAGVRNHQRVRVHVGTAERLATLVLLGPVQKILPKESGYCQLTVAEPVQAMRGDRFIIRDETAQRTLGGGVVIHPWAAKHKRTEPGLLDTLRVLADGELSGAVRIFLNQSAPFVLPISAIHQFANLLEDDVRAELERMDSVSVVVLEGEKLYTTGVRLTRLEERLVRTLRAFHTDHPLAAGMEMEVVREGLKDGLTPRLFRAVVETLEARKTIVREGNLLRLPTHVVRLAGGEQALVETITALLRKQPLMPPDLKQIEADSGVGRVKLLEVLRVMEREASIVRVAPDLYFLRDAIESMKATLAQHLSHKGDVTPAMFRDLFGTSRKYAIPLLEYLDREGVTVRAGDARRLKRGVGG